MAHTMVPLGQIQTPFRLRMDSGEVRKAEVNIRIEAFLRLQATTDLPTTHRTNRRGCNP